MEAGRDTDSRLGIHAMKLSSCPKGQYLESLSSALLESKSYIDVYAVVGRTLDVT